MSSRLFAATVAAFTCTPFIAAAMASWVGGYPLHLAMQVLGALLMLLWPCSMVLWAVFYSAHIKQERARTASFVAMARAKYRTPAKAG